MKETAFRTIFLEHNKSPTIMQQFICNIVYCIVDALPVNVFFVKIFAFSSQCKRLYIGDWMLGPNGQSSHFGSQHLDGSMWMWLIRSLWRWRRQGATCMHISHCGTMTFYLKICNRSTFSEAENVIDQK